MRRVIEDINYNGVHIAAGKTVAISTYGSHRNADFFPDPEMFNPHREEPDNLFAYIPFGGGPHKFGGNAFALLQLKAIFSALLRNYRFELVNASDTYQEDMPAMVLRPTRPCMLRYKRRN